MNVVSDDYKAAKNGRKPKSIIRPSDFCSICACLFCYSLAESWQDVLHISRRCYTVSHSSTTMSVTIIVSRRSKMITSSSLFLFMIGCYQDDDNILSPFNQFTFFPSPTQSNFRFALASSSLARDSIRAFNDRIKIRENRWL